MEYEFTSLIKYDNNGIYFNETSLEYDENKSDIFISTDSKDMLIHKAYFLTQAKLFKNYACLTLLKLMNCENNKRYKFKISIEEVNNE